VVNLYPCRGDGRRARRFESASEHRYRRPVDDPSAAKNHDFLGVVTDLGGLSGAARRFEAFALRWRLRRRPRGGLVPAPLLRYRDRRWLRSRSARSSHATGARRHASPRLALRRELLIRSGLLCRRPARPLIVHISPVISRQGDELQQSHDNRRRLRLCPRILRARGREIINLASPAASPRRRRSRAAYAGALKSDPLSAFVGHRRAHRPRPGTATLVADLFVRGR